MWSTPPSTKSTAHPQNEEYCPVAIHNPLTGSEPNQLDNFDYSETLAAIFQNESVDIDTEPSYSCDAGDAELVKTTPQMTRFRNAKVCNNLATDEIDDHRIQSDYNMNCNIQKERTLHLVLRMRGENSRHQ